MLHFVFVVDFVVCGLLETLDMYRLQLVACMFALISSTALRGDFSPEARAVWSRFEDSLNAIRYFEYDATLTYESSSGAILANEAQTRVEDRLAGRSIVRFRDFAEVDASVYVENADEHILRIRNTMHATKGSGKFDFSQSAIKPFAVWPAILTGAIGVGEARMNITMNLDECVAFYRSMRGEVGDDSEDYVDLILIPSIGSDSVCRVRFSKKQGYVPVEFVHAPIDPEKWNGELGAEVGKWQTPKNSARTKWERQTGSVFVPVVIEGFTELRDETRTTLIAVSWKSVNIPIDENKFTIDGIGLAAGTSVFNQTLGTPFLEEIVGRDTPGSYPGNNGNTRVVRDPSLFRVVLVISSLVVFVALLLFAAWSRVSNAKSS